MNTTQNTVLITGGSAGIGFQMAKQLSEAGNKVIIIGRNAERLEKAAAQLNNVTAIAADVTSHDDITQLAARMNYEFPELNMLINNAGSAFVYKLDSQSNAFDKASDEMLTNYLSVIGITEKLLPLLRKQPEAAIVNVSSIVAFAPGLNLPTYSASKAALHSYTKTLRLTLQQDSNIRVFELMPPLVDTDFSKEIGGEKGIKPAVVAQNMIEAIQNDTYEIHVGQTADIYKLSQKSQQEALYALNGIS